MKRFLSITLIAILLVASCFTAFGASRSEMLEFMREGNLSMMQVIMRDYPSAWQGGWFNWNHDDDFLAVLPG